MAQEKILLAQRLRNKKPTLIEKSSLLEQKRGEFDSDYYPLRRLNLECYQADPVLKVPLFDKIFAGFLLIICLWIWAILISWIWG
jgi:hypothetical protein